MNTWSNEMSMSDLMYEAAQETSELVERAVDETVEWVQEQDESEDFEQLTAFEEEQKNGNTNTTSYYCSTKIQNS